MSYDCAQVWWKNKMPRNPFWPASLYISWWGKRKNKKPFKMMMYYSGNHYIKYATCSRSDFSAYFSYPPWTPSRKFLHNFLNSVMLLSVLNIWPSTFWIVISSNSASIPMTWSWAQFSQKAPILYLKNLSDKHIIKFFGNQLQWLFVLCLKLWWLSLNCV